MSRHAANLDILLEDGPLIAVNKPSGLISQGAPIGQPSVVSLVKDYLRQKYHKSGNVYLGIPHRLDRPVSGVMVFSRNSKCAKRLAEQFANRVVRKTYRAILERPPRPRAGFLEDWIYRIPDEPRVVISSPQKPGAKEARLSYRTLEVVRGRGLVEVDLMTGRMHQIRIQFASRNCPIVGDQQYGAKTRLPDVPDGELGPIALHAAQLTLQHPIRYEELTITAPVPDVWHQLGFTVLD